MSALDPASAAPAPDAAPEPSPAPAAPAPPPGALVRLDETQVGLVVGAINAQGLITVAMLERLALVDPAVLVALDA